MDLFKKGQFFAMLVNSGSWGCYGISIGQVQFWWSGTSSFRRNWKLPD